MSKLKLALMDMNDGTPNQGMRGLRIITEKFAHELDVTEFEVRQKGQIPDLSFDIYISSGGPGDPRSGDGDWDQRWFQLIDALWQHNLHSQSKKFVFFVCHSFQMACHHFNLCAITRRKSTSFGIYPIHKTAAGQNDLLLKDLADPYYGVDSRDWQLVTPKMDRFQQLGATIISLEKIRTHVEYERAIMGIRFSPEIVGTQFHPEADPEGMKVHFAQEENRQKVIKNFDLEKYDKMMQYLEDPQTIARTFEAVIPGFISSAIKSLSTYQSV